MNGDRHPVYLPYQNNVEKPAVSEKQDPLHVQQVDCDPVISSVRPKFYQELPLGEENIETKPKIEAIPQACIIKYEIPPIIRTSEQCTYQPEPEKHSPKPLELETHNSDKTFMCYICKKGFETEKIRDKHLEEHDKVLKVSGKRAREGLYEKDKKIPLTDLQCYICYEKFENTLQLKSHLKTQHKGNVIHICPYCNKVFSLKCNLNAHITIHKNDKPFECKICGKTFKRKRLLKVHTEVHNRKHEFKCHVCDKIVVRMNVMKAHYNNRHKGIDLPSIEILQAHLK